MNRTLGIAGRIGLIALVMLAGFPSGKLLGQALSAALSQLQSGDYYVRKEGFYQILHAANVGAPSNPSLRPRCERLATYTIEHPETRVALIAVLERENMPDTAKGMLSEDPYYGDLIGCVAAFKDPRAANALIGAVETGWMAMDGLVALGQDAVPPLLAKLHSRDWEMARSSAASVLGLIAARSRQMPVDTTAIEAGLIKALSDQSMYVRLSSVEALSQFSNQRVRSAITSLAHTDPAVTIRRGKRTYPVRAAAIKWVRHDDSLRVVRASH